MTPDERLALAVSKFGDEGEAADLLEATARRLAWRSEHGGKECSRCREILPVGEFAKDNRRPDGLAYTCRTCTARYLKSWRAKGV